MDSQRVEFESEAWYRAIAEGRLAAVSDRRSGQVWPLPARKGHSGASPIHWSLNRQDRGKP